MSDKKEKSAVGVATPATESRENSTTESIAENSGIIKIIPIENLKHHPDNPRKDIGDISELTESIRKNGIMQNLTVVPEGGELWVLIGNRRFEAAKAAGLTELPCKIVDGLSKAEQVGIMLEENMQRNDLTVIEQAQGFQLMLDLGETVHSIADRTGFSETTVRRRLNIAQLDSKALTKAYDEWQITLDDLKELEKIKNVGTRNMLLRKAGNSVSLRNSISFELREEKVQESKKAIEKLLKKEGITYNADAKNKVWYSDIYEIIKRYELDDDPPKRLSFPKTEGLIYTIAYHTLYILKAKPKGKKALTEQEKKQREIKANVKKIKEIIKQTDSEMVQYIRQLMIDHSRGLVGIGLVTPSEERWAWNILTNARAVVSRNDLAAVFLDKESWQITPEEVKSVHLKLQKVPVVLQMIYICALQPGTYPPVDDYTGKYCKDRTVVRNEVYSVIESWGFEFPEDRKEEFEAVLKGKSNLYTREEKENA